MAGHSGIRRIAVLSTAVGCAWLVFLHASAAVARPPNARGTTPEGKRWIDNCFADYDDFEKKWAPIEKEARAELESIPKTNFYIAFPKLQALYESLALKSHRAGLWNGQSASYARREGVAFDVAKAIVDLQNRTGRNFAGLFAKSGWRESSKEDENFERNHYCMEAYSSGTHLHRKSFEGVQLFWLSEAERQTHLAKEQAKEEAGVAMFGKSQDLPITDLDKISFSKTPSEEPLVRLYVEVAEVDRRGDTTIVRAVKRNTGTGDCRTTNRVNRIDRASGRVEYAVDCSFKEYKASKVTLSFADLPPTGIRRGDKLKVLGRLTGVDGLNYVVTGLHVASLDRGKDSKHYDLQVRINAVGQVPLSTQ